MFVTRQVLEAHFSEKKAACGWIIYSNEEGNILVSTYLHTFPIPELGTETPILIVGKDDTTVSITDTTKAEKGIPLVKYPSYLDKLDDDLRMLAGIFIAQEYEDSFLKTVLDLIYDTRDQIAYSEEIVVQRKEKSHPSPFEVGDLIWVDPDLALGIGNFSKEEHLDNLVKEYSGEKVNQLCFILERYLSWHGVKPKQSPLTEFVDKTLSVEVYKERLEEMREDVDSWIRRMRSTILAQEY